MTFPSVQAFDVITTLSTLEPKPRSSPDMTLDTLWNLAALAAFRLAWLGADSVPVGLLISLRGKSLVLSSSMLRIGLVRLYRPSGTPRLPLLFPEWNRLAV